MATESLDLREKYRSPNFGAILGNKLTLSYLINSASTLRIPNGILFHGRGGTGKTTCAQVYSKALCCLNFNGDVCGQCEPCQSIESSYPNSSVTYGIHVHDCTRIDEKTLNDLIYNQLHCIHFNKIQRDVHIFDQFDLIRDRTQDKFLKQLEMRNPHILFIFCLVDISSIEPLFRDRVTVLKTTRPEMEEILPWLEHICKAEGIVVKEKEALRYLVKEADFVERACIAMVEKILGLRQPITVGLLRELSEDNESVNDDGTNRRIID
jgi:DNA polymerase-3 subunit gamma/tau